MITYIIVIIFIVLILTVWIWWGIKQLAKGARRINEEMEIESKEPDPKDVEYSRKIARTILAYIIGFVIINAILYVSQEIYHRSDVNKCKELAKQLEQMKEVIENYKEEAYKNAVAHGKAITNIEVEEHSRLVDEYNLVVEDYNKIAKYAYSRWYLFPLPGPKGKAFSTLH